MVEYKRTSQPWVYGTTVVHFMFVFHSILVWLKFVNNSTHNCLSYCHSKNGLFRCLSYCHSKNGLFRKNSHNFWPSYFYMSFTKPHKSSSKLLLLCHSQSWNLIPRPFCYTKLCKNSCALKTKSAGEIQGIYRYQSVAVVLTTTLQSETLKKLREPKWKRWALLALIKNKIYSDL